MNFPSFSSFSLFSGFQAASGGANADIGSTCIETPFGPPPGPVVALQGVSQSVDTFEMPREISAHPSMGGPATGEGGPPVVASAGTIAVKIGQIVRDTAIAKGLELLAVKAAEEVYDGAKKIVSGTQAAINDAKKLNSAMTGR